MSDDRPKGRRALHDCPRLLARTYWLFLFQCCSAAPKSASTFVLHTADEARTEQFLGAAEQQLTKNCMTSAGFKYYIDPRSQYTGNEPFVDADTEPDIQYRQVHGYDLAAEFRNNANSQPDQDRATTQPANDIYVSHLSKGEAQTYNSALQGSLADRRSITLSNGSTIGFSDGGCIGQVNREIYGNSTTAIRLSQEPDRIRADWSSRLTSDRRYQDALGAWSKCMTKAGFTFDTPEHATAALANEYSIKGTTADLEAKEIRTAVVDAQCAIATNIVDTVRAIKAGYANSMSSADEQTITSLSEEQDLAVARVKDQLKVTP